jgi:hypothetical protein
VESVAGERAVACEVPHAKEALVNRPFEQRRSVKLDQHSHANKKYVGLRAARDPVSPALQASAPADYRFDFSCNLGTRECNGDISIVGRRSPSVWAESPGRRRGLSPS